MANTKQEQVLSVLQLAQTHADVKTFDRISGMIDW